LFVFLDLQKNEKKSWVNKLEYFVKTKASTKVLESIKKEQCVMITGPFALSTPPTGVMIIQWIFSKHIIYYE
jgi:hypothetical protein